MLEGINYIHAKFQINIVENKKENKRNKECCYTTLKTTLYFINCSTNIEVVKQTQQREKQVLPIEGAWMGNFPMKL